MTRKAYSNYLITSDPHFENDYILDIERGNKFKTIQEHDDTILNLYDRWMGKLDKKKNAAFFVLGDFGLTIKNKFGKNTKKELDDSGVAYKESCPEGAACVEWIKGTAAYYCLPSSKGSAGSYSGGKSSGKSDSKGSKEE